MSIALHTIRTLLKRPFIIVYCGVFSLLCTILNYNISSILLRFEELEESSIYESIIHLIQLVYNYLANFESFFSIILYFFIIVFIISVPLALFISGYLYIVNNTVNARKRTNNEFFKGVKKYYIRILVMTFITLTISILFIIFISIASVPAIVITNAVVEGSPELVGAAIFVDILTVSMLFFVSVCFRAYIFAWYPAVYERKKKAFSLGKKLVNKHFWAFTFRITLFDIIFILFIILPSKIFEGTPLFLFNWLFITLFFSFFIVYIFSIFRLFMLYNKDTEKSA